MIFYLRSSLVLKISIAAYLEWKQLKSRVTLKPDSQLNLFFYVMSTNYFSQAQFIPLADGQYIFSH